MCDDVIHRTSPQLPAYPFLPTPRICTWCGAVFPLLVQLQPITADERPQLGGNPNWEGRRSAAFGLVSAGSNFHLSATMETPLHPTPMARPMMKGKIFVDVSNKPTFQVRAGMFVGLAGWIGWGVGLQQKWFVQKWSARFVLALCLETPPSIQFAEREKLHRTFDGPVGPSCRHSTFVLSPVARYHYGIRSGRGGRWRRCAGSLSS